MGSYLDKDDDSKQSRLNEILRQYRVLKEASNEEVTVLENIYNPQALVELRNIKFTSEDNYNKKVKLLEKTKSIIQPCILRIIGLHNVKLEQFCTTMYQISIVLEKPIQTMEGFLQQRGAQDFSETELWFLLDCLVSAQSTLQNLQHPIRSLCFQDILMCSINQPQSTASIWKVAPIELEFDNYKYTSIYNKFRQNLSLPEEQRWYHLYPSPEELRHLQAQATEPSGDFYKQSVFTLGILILHLAQGAACDHIYDMSKLIIVDYLLNERLHELNDKFSQDFCDLIRLMVVMDEDNRLDYIQLDKKMNGLEALHGKRISDRAFTYQSMQLVHQVKQPVQSTIQTIPQQSYQNLQQSQFPQSFSTPQPQRGLVNQTFQTPQSQEYRQFPNQPQFTSQFPQSQAYTPYAQLNEQEQQRSGYTVNEPVTVTESYQNGSRYTGDKLNGLRHGKGRMTFAEGGFYEGQWKENNMEGKGQLYYDNQQKAYDGEFKNSQFHNYGHLFNKLPQHLSSPFDYKNFNNLNDYWTKYEGDFNNDKKNGFGVLYLTNGEKYVGSFKDDFLHGYGAFTKQDGQTLNTYYEHSILLRIV